MGITTPDIPSELPQCSQFYVWPPELHELHAMSLFSLLPPSREDSHISLMAMSNQACSRDTRDRSISSVRKITRSINPSGVVSSSLHETAAETDPCRRRRAKERGQENGSE